MTDTVEKFLWPYLLDATKALGLDVEVVSDPTEVERLRSVRHVLVTRVKGEFEKCRWWIFWPYGGGFSWSRSGPVSHCNFLDIESDPYLSSFDRLGWRDARKMAVTEALKTIIYGYDWGAGEPPAPIVMQDRRTKGGYAAIRITKKEGK